MQKFAPHSGPPPPKQKACYKWWWSVGLTGALIILMNVIHCKKSNRAHSALSLLTFPPTPPPPPPKFFNFFQKNKILWRKMKTVLEYSGML
jgi:hypothetical protein